MLNYCFSFYMDIFYQRSFSQHGTHEGANTTLMLVLYANTSLINMNCAHPSASISGKSIYVFFMYFNFVYKMMQMSTLLAFMYSSIVDIKAHDQSHLTDPEAVGKTSYRRLFR